MEFQRRLQRDVKRVKVLRERERVHSVRPEMAQAMAVNQLKAPGRWGQELETSRYDYNQGKNKDRNLKSQGVLLKA